MSITLISATNRKLLKVKVCHSGGVGHSGDQISRAPGAKPWRYMHSLSYITNVRLALADNLSEKCPTKLTDFCLSFVPLITHYLTGAAYSPMAFTRCHDRGSNLLPPDEKAGNLPTQSI